MDARMFIRIPNDMEMKLYLIEIYEEWETIKAVYEEVKGMYSE